MTEYQCMCAEGFPESCPCKRRIEIDGLEQAARNLLTWHFLQGPGSGPQPYVATAWEDLTEQQRQHYLKGAAFVVGADATDVTP